ncbi:MAG: vanadium-dependent haloperoxidase [Hydrogenophaga sp.]|uniref:vanadium-dependent haloperoxidase n=1 Tax=Hydrogenophaga sp. TaxID=1904254 RepID=UPI0025BC73E7|nr:vanadium-dependent haloperoxidase [Hydrogenophaga sp.]MBT9550600.1 vanadium-dependent haloperoxidase [Hydrogenophaga sp.]
MRRPIARGLLGLAALCATLPAQAQAPSPAPAVAPSAEAYSAEVATEWFALALLLTQQTPGMSPPVASRALAYLGLALYESVAPGMPGHRSLAGQLNELQSLPWAQPDEPLHWPTVAHTAMASMTRMMFPHASAENKARIDLLERSLPQKLARDFDPQLVNAEVRTRSETFGKLMAMALMTWARTDGGHEAWGPLRRHQANYVPPSGAGQWVPTPPAYAPPLLPWWGTVRPFALPVADACPAPPPPAYSEEAGSAFQRETGEVHRISQAATQAQRQVSLYWADDPLKTPTPAGHWSFIASDQLKAGKASLARAARVYARLHLAMADAFIATWKTKYTVNLLRPVTAVQLTLDSQWVPTLMHTPPFPEYPSGHSVLSSAAAGVLEQEFGTSTRFTDNTHNDRGWGPRSFASFRAAADEAAVSRLYAGIHFRSGIEGGKVQGRCVAERVIGLSMGAP